MLAVVQLYTSMAYTSTLLLSYRTYKRGRPIVSPMRQLRAIAITATAWRTTGGRTSTPDSTSFRFGIKQSIRGCNSHHPFVTVVRYPPEWVEFYSYSELYVIPDSG